MNRNQIIEILIEQETGRVINGKAVWDEIEYAAGQYEGEDGMVMLTGEDSPKERWDYWVEIKRETDEWGDTETEIILLEIMILDKKTQKTEHVQVKNAKI